MILKSYEALIEIVATMTITLRMSRLSCFILLAEFVLSFVSTVNLFINLASFAFRMASLCYWRHKHSLYRFWKFADTWRHGINIVVFSEEMCKRLDSVGIRDCKKYGRSVPDTHSNQSTLRDSRQFVFWDVMR